MLSFDRNRKRRSLSRRSRSRLNPPVLERIPRSMPVDQIPFPDYVYGSTAGPPQSAFYNQPYFGSQPRTDALGSGVTPGMMRTPGRSYPGYAGASGPTNVYGGQYPYYPGVPLAAAPVPVSGTSNIPGVVRTPFPGAIAVSPYTSGPFVPPMWLSERSYARLEVQDTERVSALTANRLAGNFLNNYQSTATSPLRLPLVIPGAGQMTGQVRSLRPPAGRRGVVGGAVCILLLFVLLGSCMAVMPGNSNSSFASFPSLDTLHSTMSHVSIPRNDNALIAAEFATATAVTQDGYDPGNMHYHGVPIAPLNSHISASDAGSLNRFFYGQCTYWANMRYHQLTHHWVPWLGNAYQWAYAAPAYGWMLSDMPNPHGPSIMVFSPYAAGSGAYGHVAVVERANPDGSVFTSNWNWDGQWATQSWMTFYPGRGISFIWFPSSSGD